MKRIILATVAILLIMVGYVFAAEVSVELEYGDMTNVSEFILKMDDTELCRGTSLNFSCPSVIITEGQHSFTAHAVDLDGDVSQPSNVFVYDHDLIPQSPTILNITITVVTLQ